MRQSSFQLPIQKAMKACGRHGPPAIFPSQCFRPIAADRMKQVWPRGGEAMAARQVQLITNRKLLGFVILCLATLSLAACTPNTQMSGVVKDNFGAAIEGVKVTVDNTAYTATTDKAGKYTVAYDPGAVNIRFT